MSQPEEQNDKGKGWAFLATMALVLNVTSQTPLQVNVQSADRVQTRATTQQVERPAQPTLSQAPADSARRQPGRQATAAEVAAKERSDRDVGALSDSQEMVESERRRKGLRDGEIYQAQKSQETTLVIDPKQDTSQQVDRHPPARKR